MANDLTLCKEDGDPTQGDQPAQKVNWLHVTMLILMFVGVNNCYWLTLYNVTSLGGNKFINGLILGVSELTSGIFAGCLMGFM